MLPSDEPAESVSPFPEIDGYRILRRLGSGGSGAVYEGVQQSLGRHVAVKVLRASEFDDEQSLARFIREAQVQASLSHPSLLAVYDSGFRDGKAFLAMELLAAGSLRDRLSERSTLPLSELLRIGVEIASAIACAHEAGIVHRDLKPENVLMTADGHCKVADFGLARHLAGGSSLTREGTVMGTPGYMGPEVLQRGDPAPSLDVYALGAMLFEMATGEKPYRGGTIAELLYKQSAKDAPLIRTIRPGLPAGLEAIVRDCLLREPASRPAALQVAERLTGLVRTGPASGAAGRGKSSLDRGDSRRAQGAAGGTLRLVGLGGALLALVSGGIAWQARHAAPPRAASSAGPVAAALAAVPPSWPRIASVMTGPTQARLELSSEAGPGARIVWSKENGAQSSEQQVAPGAREVAVGGLAPATKYRFRLQTGGGRREVFGKTLVQDRGALAFWLDRRSAREIDVAVEGERLWLVWRTLKKFPQELLFAESGDAGRSWTEPVAIAEPDAAETRIPSFVRVRGGLVAAWTGSGDPARTQLRYRADGDPRWIDLGKYETASHDPILIASGDRVELFTWERLARGGAGLVRRRLRFPFAGVEPSVSSLAWPHAEKIGRCLDLALFGPSLVAWSCFTSRTGAVPAILSSRAEFLEPDRWPSRATLTDAAETSEDEPSLAAFEGGLCLAYVQRDEVKCRLSKDGGRTFGVSRPAIPGDFSVKVKRAALATAGRKILLGMTYTEISYLIHTGVCLYSSEDAVHWTLEGRQRLPLLSASSCLRVVPGKGDALMVIGDKDDGVILTRLAMKP